MTRDVCTFRFSNDGIVDGGDVSKERENIDETVRKEKPSKRRLKKEKAIEMATRRKQTGRATAMRNALNYVSMVGSLNSLSIRFPLASFHGSVLFFVISLAHRFVISMRVYSGNTPEANGNSRN